MYVCMYVCICLLVLSIFQSINITIMLVDIYFMLNIAFRDNPIIIPHQYFSRFIYFNTYR